VNARRNRYKVRQQRWRTGTQAPRLAVDPELEPWPTVAALRLSAAIWRPITRSWAAADQARKTWWRLPGKKKKKKASPSPRPPPGVLGAGNLTTSPLRRAAPGFCPAQQQPHWGPDCWCRQRPAARPRPAGASGKRGRRPLHSEIESKRAGGPAPPGGELTWPEQESLALRTLRPGLDPAAGACPAARSQQFPVRWPAAPCWWRQLARFPAFKLELVGTARRPARSGWAAKGWCSSLLAQWRRVWALLIEGGSATQAHAAGPQPRTGEVLQRRPEGWSWSRATGSDYDPPATALPCWPCGLPCSPSGVAGRSAAPQAQAALIDAKNPQPGAHLSLAKPVRQVRWLVGGLIPNAIAHWRGARYRAPGKEAQQPAITTTGPQDGRFKAPESSSVSQFIFCAEGPEAPKASKHVGIERLPQPNRGAHRQGIPQTTTDAAAPPRPLGDSESPTTRAIQKMNTER